MEDAAILELYERRDEAAIAETACKYGQRLLRVSANMIAGLQDAEECVNDTYLAAWNAIPPEHPESLYAYLCRIVRNLTCKRLRYHGAAKRRAELLSLDAELSEVIPDRGAAAPDGGEEALAPLLDSFLTALDPETRMLFVRRYFYADSLTSLSTLTGLRENSIAVRLRRMRARLRHFLEKEGYPL